VDSISLFAPAKLNLFLAVTGRRPDGFHDLVSVAAPLDFGDSLRAERAAGFSLTCDQAEVPVDASNLVLKAARVFVDATGWSGGVRFVLEKRIPLGAGLGGGSSNAVAALRALNALAGTPLASEQVTAVALQLGSDCPLFLQDGPVVMRGRGEQIAPLPRAALARVRGRRLLVFKPAFAIATPWAYAQMVAGAPGSYLPPAVAEERLAAWLDRADAPLETLLFNNMEPAAFRKFPALPALLEQLQATFGLQSRMSGSGSACFAVLPDTADVAPIAAAIRAAWGASAFVIDTRLA
jgi:4-diphosphocytidyl-2-C-methyl-D-erythritol kinase